MRRPMIYDKTLSSGLRFDRDVRLYKTNIKSYRKFLTLHNQIFKTSQWYRFSYRFEVLLESVFMLKSRHFIVKDVRNNIIGIITLTEKRRDCIWIYNVGVVPGKRHQGYAISFLSKVLLSYLDKPVKVCLTVNTNNNKAVNLYKKLGFKFLQRRHKNGCKEERVI